MEIKNQIFLDIQTQLQKQTQIMETYQCQNEALQQQIYFLKSKITALELRLDDLEIVDVFLQASRILNKT